MDFITQEKELTWLRHIQVLYFYSDWMTYHLKMLLMLDKAEQKHKDMAFFAIDVDYFSSLIRRFNIESIPTVILIKDFKEVHRIKSLLPAADFTAVFDDICKSESHNLYGELL
jgi:thioredoxin-like negative regulator of GroEL